MINGEQPINPCKISADRYNDEYFGLTKREYFAAMAMQGYIAAGKGSNAIDWVRCADELLKALKSKSE